MNWERFENDTVHDNSRSSCFMENNSGCDPLQMRGASDQRGCPLWAQLADSRNVEKPPMLNSPVLRPMLQSEPFPREQTEKRRKNKNNSWTSAQKLDCAVKVE